MIFQLAFLMNITTGLTIFSNPLMALERLHFSVFALGVLGALAAGTYALTCLGSGHVIDRVGYRKTIAGSCLLLLAVFFLFSLVRFPWEMFLLVAAGSLGTAFFWPSMMRWVGEEERGEELRVRIGNFNLALMAGVMVGPVIGGVIFPVNYRFPYLLAVLMVFLVLLLFLFRREEAKKAAGSTIPAAQDSEKSAFSPAFIYVGWVANFASWFAIGSAETLFPKLALQLGVSKLALGILISLIPLGQIVVFVWLRRGGGWHYNFRLLIAFQLLGAAGMALFFAAGAGWIFALAFLLTGFCGGMTYFSSLFYSLYRQEAKGRKSGFHESFLGLGVALGPLAGGLVASGGGLRAPYMLNIVVFFLAVIAQGEILRRAGSRSAPKTGGLPTERTN